MRIEPPTLTRLETALATLRQATGLDGRLAKVAPGAREAAGDAVVELRTDGRKYLFTVEAKALDRPEALGPLKARLEQFRHPGLVFAPYVTDTMAKKCRELDVAFLDDAGNAYLKRPGLFLFMTGQKAKGGAYATKPVRGLDTPAALRMVFGVLCRPKLLNAPYREIQDTTGIALGAIGAIFRDLRRRGYLTMGARQRTRRLVEPVRLFEEWVTNYPIRLRPKLNLHRFQDAAAPNWWRTVPVHDWRAAWGGEVAADRLTGYLKPTTFTLYMPRDETRKPLRELVARYRLQADPEGTIEILDQFWNFALNPAMPDLVPPILIYADLVATLDPRNLEAAKLVRERYIDDVLRTF
jgi:hypothetical protein